MKFEIFFVIIIIFIVSIALAIIISDNRGYRQGQLDAINGEIHYKLVKQENREMNWEWK